MTILKRIIYTLPTVIIALTIFIVSHQPNIKLPDLEFKLFDKFLHFSIYFIFGIALFITIANNLTKISNLSHSIIIILIGILYAISDEFHQSFIPGRTSETADVIADILGVCSAVLLINLIRVKNCSFREILSFNFHKCPKKLSSDENPDISEAN